jgi:hypothetical protein
MGSFEGSGKIRVHDGGGLEVSRDGGLTWSAISGALSAIADQTVLGNVSGVAAAPVALSAAQQLTMLGVTPFNSELNNAFIRAQSLCGPTLTVANGSECVRLDDFAALTGGTLTLNTTLSGGVIQVGTGAVASTFNRTVLTGTTCQLADFLSIKWYSYWRAAFATAIDGVGQVYLNLTAPTGNTFVALGLLGAGSTTNLSYSFTDPSGAVKASTVATAIATDLAFHDFEMVNDGVNFRLYYDKALVYSIALASCSGAGVIRQQIHTFNGATATNRQINVDRQYMITAPN